MAKDEKSKGPSKADLSHLGRGHLGRFDQQPIREVKESAPLPRQAKQIERMYFGTPEAVAVVRANHEAATGLRRRMQAEIEIESAALSKKIPRSLREYNPTEEAGNVPSKKPGRAGSAAIGAAAVLDSDFGDAENAASGATAAKKPARAKAALAKAEAKVGALPATPEAPAPKKSRKAAKKKSGTPPARKRGRPASGEPWIGLGISRRTYFAKKKAGEL